jgi:hypothetical protein
MLLCRVSLGDYYTMPKGTTDRNLRLPPHKAGSSARHDSVVGFVATGTGLSVLESVLIG